MELKDARYQLRLPEEEKKRWQDYVDEHGNMTLASLIRSSVNDRITPTNGSSGDRDFDFSKVERYIDSKFDKVYSMMSQLLHISDPNLSDWTKKTRRDIYNYTEEFYLETDANPFNHIPSESEYINVYRYLQDNGIEIGRYIKEINRQQKNDVDSKRPLHQIIDQVKVQLTTKLLAQKGKEKGGNDFDF